MSIDRADSQAHTLQLAISFHKAGELGRAETLYKDVVKRQPKHIDANYLLGLVSAQQGNFEPAAQFLSRAARLRPEFLDAHYNCGVALNALSRHADALARYDKVLALNSDHIGALQNRAGSLFEMRRFSEALDSYDKVLAVMGAHADTLDNRGVALRELYRFDEALESHKRALAIAPDHVPALTNCGAALRALGRHQEALGCYERAITLDPRYGEAHYNRAVALLELKRFEEALQDCDAGIALSPRHADAHQNRGVVLLELGRHDEALQSFERAIEIRPDHAEAFSNSGLALRGLNRFGEALSHLDRAIRLNARSAGAHNNRGLVLNDLGRFEDALQSFDRALAIDPVYADAWCNRGIALTELKRFEEAIESYDRVIAIDPTYAFIYGTRLHAKMRICDWADLEKDISIVAEKAVAGEKASHPFPLLAAVDSPPLLRQATEIWRKHSCPALRVPPVAEKLSHPKIRLGYFSADFHAHATAYLIADLFEQHERSKFELVAFSFDPDPDDAMRARLRAAFDAFIDVRAMSDEEVSRLARTKEIDIAVDLKGYTKDSRPGIFARRAAPVQVNFLGYPGTMAADYIDYIVADPIVIPPSQQISYCEKIVTLPHCYQPNDRKRAIAEKIVTRAQASLPEQGFVFCCFNNNYKILPDVFDLWMQILRAVDGSVLWLLEDNKSAATNLAKEAGARGIDPRRLIFARYMPIEDHLARLRLADLCLDTVPYNAHTTASDALWAGLPVLTRIGETFAGRVAASLLHAAGLPELVTTTAQDYVALAVALARDPDRLASIKKKLSTGKLEMPLFDTPRYTRHLEAAYKMMSERRHAGLPPDHIDVPASS